MFGDQIQKSKKLNSCRFRDCKYEKNNLPPNRIHEIQSNHVKSLKI